VAFQNKLSSMKSDKAILPAAAVAVILLVSSWFVPLVYIGLAGLIYIILLSLRWGLRGGLPAACWGTLVILVAFTLQGGMIINIIVSLFVYILIGIGLGRIIDLHRKQQFILRKQDSELTQANETLKAILDNTLFGVAIIDRSRTIRWVNNIVCKMAGVETPSDLIGKQCGDYLCPAQKQECPILDHNQTLDNSERILRRHDGKIIPILKTVTKITLDGEDMLLETFIDISEQKKAEEELLKFKTAVEQSVDGVAMADMSGNIIFINEAWAKMHGFSAEEATGKNLTIFHSEEQIEKYVIPFTETLKTNGSNQGEIEHTRKDGTVFPTYMATTVVKGVDGKPFGMLAIARDITEQISAERDLTDQKERLANIVEGANVGTWEWNIQTGKLIFNKKRAEITGHTLEELSTASRESCGELTHPDDLEALNLVLEQHISGKLDAYNIEYRTRHKEGHWIWVNDRGKVRSWTEDGKPLWVYGTLIDITERKQAEEALAIRLAFEEMVSRISANFVNLPPGQIDEGISYTLKSVGEFFEVDRSYLYRFSEDGKTYSVTHIWCRDGVDGYFEKDQDFPVELTPWWISELKSGRLVKIADVSQMPDQLALDRADFLSEDIKSIFTIPMTLEGKVFGCFGFDTVYKLKTWTDEQVALLQVIVELITGAFARHDADRQIRMLSFHDQLTGLYNRRYFNNEIERLEGSREYPVTIISADLDGLKLVNDTVGHAEGDRYLQAGAELLKNNLRSSDVLARVGGDEFALLLPRTGKTEAIMMMNRIRRQVEDYNTTQTGLPLSISLGLDVSETAEYPLEETYNTADNNMYSDKLRRGKIARAKIVKSLLSSLFERGNLDEGERNQVQELTIRMGLALKLEENRMADLELLSQVYDLGKVGLPDGLLHRGMLTKKEELSSAEREAIFRHPEIGYRIASASPELANVADMVLKHHENYDGSGYPLGLKGEEIPLENRILSIAIAYSAMTNPRVHAKMLTHEEALLELKHSSGSQFDPKLVEIFLNI
jgi:diguanylate cyclase (GGDEF)-like protein/PAS domain S-box-containing protein